LFKVRHNARVGGFVAIYNSGMYGCMVGVVVQKIVALKQKIPIFLSNEGSEIILLGKFCWGI